MPPDDPRSVQEPESSSARQALPQVLHDKKKQTNKETTTTVGPRTGIMRTDWQTRDFPNTKRILSSRGILLNEHSVVNCFIHYKRLFVTHVSKICYDCPKASLIVVTFLEV